MSLITPIPNDPNRPRKRVHVDVTNDLCVSFYDREPRETKWSSTTQMDAMHVAALIMARIAALEETQRELRRALYALPVDLAARRRAEVEAMQEGDR